MRNIRKYIHLFVALLSVVLFGACTFEQENLFDESASLRVNHFNEDLKERLVAQSTNGNYGWEIQYFVAGTGYQDFEGFTLYGSFTETGKVTLASNHRYLRNGNAGKYTEATSTYEMLAEEGPMIAFNTWNDVLTVFVDPVDPSYAPDNIVSNGEGMNGDHNLVFVRYEGNNIIFRGQRHAAEVRFVPCDRPWAQHLTDIATMKKSITSSTLNTYYLTDGKDTMYIDGLNEGVFSIVDRLEDPLLDLTRNCLFTSSGIRLSYKQSFGDHEYQEFSISDDKSRLLSEDGSVQIIAMWDTYITDSKSLYRIDPSGFTAEQAALYTQMQAEVKKVNASFGLDSLAIGRISSEQADGTSAFMPGLILCIHGKKNMMGLTPQYYPYFDVNIDRTEFGVMKLSESSVTAPNTYMTMFDATNLKSLCKQFAESLYGTYDIVPNDYFRPTDATLNRQDGGNTLKLFLSAIKD